jgi:hypothetical protein
MLQLDVDAVEVAKLRGDLPDVVIAHPLYASMRAPQQVLVEIEDGDIHHRLELPFQRPGVASDAAELIIRAHDGEPARSGGGVGWASFELDVHLGFHQDIA